jgi:hypothetical protein
MWQEFSAVLGRYKEVLRTFVMLKISCPNEDSMIHWLLFAILGIREEMGS